MRNSNTGGLEVANNQITNAAFIGAVGLEWQFSGVGNFSRVAGETDLLLRNVNTGGLEVYDINNNQLTGAAFLGPIGLEWQFAGVAPVSGAGRSAASPSIPRLYPWVTQVRSPNSWKRWRALAAAQSTASIPSRSVPTRHRSRC